MNSKEFSKLQTLLFLTIITSSILTFITSVSGINIKYFDDASILILFIFIFFINKKIELKLIKWPIIFVLISLISLIVNFTLSNITSYLIQIKNYLLPCLIFVIASVIYNEAIYKKYLRYYLYFSITLAIIGILEFIINKHFYEVYGVFGNLSSVNPFRSYSLVGSPVDFGFFLILPIIYSFLFYTKKYLSLFFLITMLLTKALGPLSLILINLFAALRFKLLSLKNFLLILIVGLLIVLNNAGLTDRVLKKQNAILDYKLINESSRYDFYIQSADVISDNIFLGVGVGNFGGWASKKDNQVYEKYNFNFYQLNSIDLFYPHLMGEVGIFGFISFLMIYLSIIFKNLTYIRIYQKSENHYGFVLAGTVFLYGISLLISGLWSMLLEINFATIPFFFIAAFSMCYYNSTIHKK
jgi:hypothetical protein